MNDLVSIITINYNGWQETCELIASLKQFETYPYEIIVVDNASKGDDADRIQAKYPDVKLVRSERNLGFAGGNNLGYKYAEGTYIFFLNNDTVIKSPVIGSLVKRLQDTSIGGVSPMIRYYAPPYGVQYYGHEKMTRITLKHATSPYDHLHPEKYLIAREIEVMHGAAMMVPRKVIEKTGTMAECYFLYYEEFDWSYHILDKGYRIWYEPASVIYHKEGTKKGLQLSPFREYYMVRGRVLFARRNLKGGERLLSCFYLLFLVMSHKWLYNLLRMRWKSLWAVTAGTFAGLFANKTTYIKE